LITLTFIRRFDVFHRLNNLKFFNRRNFQLKRFKVLIKILFK